MEKKMNKKELKKQLFEKKDLRDVLPIKTDPRTDADIYKGIFNIDDQVSYIPDLGLFDLYHPYSDETTSEWVKRVLSMVYTGRDFIAICQGDIGDAKKLFEKCSWQTPVFDLISSDPNNEQNTLMFTHTA